MLHFHSEALERSNASNAPLLPQVKQTERQASVYLVSLSGRTRCVIRRPDSSATA